MGMVRHEAYILLIQGENVLSYLDGLSTNLIEGSCTTIFTSRAAKILDVCEVIQIDNGVALVGYLPHKEALTEHLAQRILGQTISISDISSLNHVFIGDGDDETPPDATVHASYFGTMYIVPVRHAWQPTWSEDEWTEYRIANTLPYYGNEITTAVHPLACGLGELVHPQKGCYIGQEVIARMLSRGKQGHHLVVRNNPVKDATTVGKEKSLSIERIR